MVIPLLYGEQTFLGCGIYFLEGEIKNNDIELLVKSRDPQLRPS